MIRVLLPILAFSLLTSCKPAPVYEKHETIAGIPHSLWINDPNPNRASRAANAVFSELRLLSEFAHPVKSKPLSRINTLLRSREWFSINPSMTGIVKQAMEYSRKTDGFYNPAAIGAFYELWGMYSDRPVMPRPQDIEALLDDLPTMKNIQFDGIRVRGTNTRMRLDFDWLAYGYAIDLQMDHLRELGIANARLKIAGVEAVTGSFARGATGQATCVRAIGSGDRLIDPTNGRPLKATGKLTVVAGDASTASVACWALVFGNDQSRRLIAEKLGVVDARVLVNQGRATDNKPE